MPFDSNADLLKTPVEGPGAIFVGEVGGVGQNSKGQIFVYTRTGHPYATLADNRTFERGGSRLFVFDRTGKFERELGQDVYGFNAAIGLRVDPQDNVWTIDEAASQIIKFDPEGRVAAGARQKAGSDRRTSGWTRRRARRSGRRRGASRSWRSRRRAGRTRSRRSASRGGRWRSAAVVADQRAPGTPGSTFSRPTDVAWDKAGNIYIADGIGNTNRVAKFDKDGKFIRQWGSTGSENGQFNGVKSLAVDAQDNVYVADLGNKRIQVFDCGGQLQVAVRQHRHADDDVHDEGADAVPLHLALRRSRGRHGRRSHLQGPARRHRRGQVRIRRTSSRSSSVWPIRSTAATRTNC